MRLLPECIEDYIGEGLLPRCYEGTSIEVEIKEQRKLSCFSLNEDGTVTCPMGCTLKTVKTREANTIYASREACRECQTRCTQSKAHKTVSFGPDTKYVPARMYGNPDKKLNPLPGDIVLYNSFGRKDKPKKQVILRIKAVPEKIHERMCLSGNPFGTVKRYDGAHYLLCRGRDKATAELGLSSLPII
jgi:transposase